MGKVLNIIVISCSALIVLSLSGGCDIKNDVWGSWFNETPHDAEQSNLPEEPSLKETNFDANIIDDEDKRVCLFYYPDKGGRFLIPVYRPMPEREDIARAVLEQLVSSSSLDEKLSAAGLATSIPENTIIRSISIEDQIATVNFSASFTTYPQEKEKLVMNSIWGTLQQFETIDQVNIKVEGVDIEEFNGDSIVEQPLGPDLKINMEVKADTEDFGEASAVKVYFNYFADGYIFHVPVNRVIEPQEDLIKASVEELLESPRSNKGLYSDIPSRTQFLDYSLEEDNNGQNIISVNFSSELLNYSGGVTGEKNIIRQIVLTLTEHPEIDGVEILVEGEKLFPQKAELSQPFSAPKLINFLSLE